MCAPFSLSPRYAKPTTTLTAFYIWRECESGKEEKGTTRIAAATAASLKFLPIVFPLTPFDFPTPNEWHSIGDQQHPLQMNKSTNSQANDPDAGLVSHAVLGKRVLVNGHFGGVLRYLGSVAGKRGLFCGVELDQPVGKNDGSHQGVFYFECRPGHGVFAPTHKVQLESQKHYESNGSSTNSRDKIASAIPSLSTTKIGVQNDNLAMEWSLMSTGSTNSSMGGSNFNIFDDALMAHSQATYTVFESECMMLSDLEMGDSALLRLDEDSDDTDRMDTFIANVRRQPRQDESVILDGPTLDIALPVICATTGYEDEPTPMVEKANTEFGKAVINQSRTFAQDGPIARDRNHLALEKLRTSGGTGGAEERGAQQRSPNNNRMEKDKSGGLSDASNNNDTRPTEERSPRRTTPNKPRISIFQSVQPPPFNIAVAAARAKPKQPSRAQLIMEQLKASIEAEKQRPKKEIRSRVHEEAKSGGEGEECDERRSIATSECSSTMRMNQMNTVARKVDDHNKTPGGSRAPSTTATPVRNTSFRPHTTQSQHPRPSANASQASANSARLHPGQLTKPPSRVKPIATRPPSRPVLSSRENTTSSTKITTPSTSRVLNPALSKKSSSVEHVAKGNLIKAATGHPSAAHQNNDKELVKKANEELQRAKGKAESNAKQREVFIILTSHLSNEAALLSSRTKELNSRLELLAAEHAHALECLERGWRKQLQEAQEEYQQKIDQIREQMSMDHSNELKRIQQQHQSVVSDLTGKVQNLAAQIKDQQAQYLEQLKESEIDKIKRLKNELESREYELQLKREELERVRKTNRELQYEADKLLGKEAQISKLEARIEDMREELNRLRQIERKLANQVEEYRQELGETKAKTEAMSKEKEVLQYHLQEQLESQTSRAQATTFTANPTPSVISTSPSIAIRTSDPRKNSTERPSSSCLSYGRVSVSHQNDHDMSRSMDSALRSPSSVISCYKQEGRNRSTNTPTKVYTPRDIYQVPLADRQEQHSAKRIVNFDSTQEEDDTMSPQTNGDRMQNDVSRTGSC